DYGWQVAADNLGNVFLSGHTFGNLAGPNLAFTSAFVSKYDSAGTLAWTRQFGRSSDNVVGGSARDGQRGIYGLGILNGYFGYVSRFDNSGTQLWQQTLDTGGQNSSSSVAVDEAGNVFVLGNTVSPRDVFLSKYTSSGTLLWRQFFGSDGVDYGESLSL